MAQITFRGTTYTIKKATTNSQTLNGTTNPDWIEALGGNNRITTGKGNDVVLAGVNFLNIGNYPPFGGEAIFWGSRTDAGNNQINTGEGDDYVAIGIGGNDIIDLGEGNDIYDGGISDLTKTTGNDIINAGAGNDIVYAWGKGDKKIDAGVGNDIIDVRGSGNTNIQGGAGDDSINVYAEDTTTIDLGIGNDTLLLLDFSENIVHHQSIVGGAGNDRLEVAALDDIFTIDAGKGNDFVSMANVKGSGTLYAGSGDDDLFVAGGKSQVFAGDGNDLIMLDGWFEDTSDNTVFAGNGNDTIFTAFYTPNGKNEIHGGSGKDTIFSGESNDTIYDDAGDDIINLRGGFVTFDKSRGKNFFSGETDRLEIKGGGVDKVYLGSGKDTVVLGKDGQATIHGFSCLDRLDLGGLNVSLNQNQQGDTLIFTNDSQHLQLATLVGYTGHVNII